LFCQVDNPHSIAEKIRQYLDNKELSKKIIFNAKNLVVKNYNWDLIAVKMRNIFNNIIK